MARPIKVNRPAGNSEVAPYMGQHLRVVDNCRVILPVEWRPGAGRMDFMVLVWPITTSEYLLVLPPSRWQVIQRNLEGLSLTDDRAARIERLISSNTSIKSLDSYGRLPLPEEAAKRLGIENEAMLVGRLDKFEIWSPSRYAATLENINKEEVAEALKSIRI